MTIEHVIGFAFGFGAGVVVMLVVAWESVGKWQARRRK